MEYSKVRSTRSMARIDKIQVAARVSQPNHDPRDGRFLLFDYLEVLGRHETLLELLNSSRIIIPFIQHDGADVLFLTRVNIDWVMVRRDVDPKLIFPPERIVTTEQRMDLRLIDESHVHAVIQWDSNHGGTRLSDYLNRPEAFIPAQTTFGILLLNKLRVRESSLEEPTERPVSHPGHTADG